MVADAVLAEEYGASYSMVHRARERLGLPSPMPSGVCPGREMRKAVLRARPWVADLGDDVGGAWGRR